MAVSVLCGLLTRDLRVSRYSPHSTTSCELELGVGNWEVAFGRCGSCTHSGLFIVYHMMYVMGCAMCCIACLFYLVYRTPLGESSILYLKLGFYRSGKAAFDNYFGRLRFFFCFFISASRAFDRRLSIVSYRTGKTELHKQSITTSQESYCIASEFPPSALEISSSATPLSFPP